MTKQAFQTNTRIMLNRVMIRAVCCMLSVTIGLTAGAGRARAEDIPKLDNSMSVDYLEKHLRKSHPRLVFDQALKEELKSMIKSDPVAKNMYAAIRLNADDILKQPVIERKMIGRRMLGTSREMLYRVNMLGLVYLMEDDPKALRRIDEELLAVCSFPDWNPSHFLDVAEMSLAVAVAIDWTAGALPESTVRLAKSALIDKGINPKKPNGKKSGPFYGTNNWNQVCNGGMIAAAIAIADEDPELAAKTIRRSLDGMPNALAEYRPDGVYPEGATYWEYATGYSVMTAAMLESAFGNDFGINKYPGFKESALFRLLCTAPSGWYFNYSDCGDRRSENGNITLAWFAMKSGNRAFFEQARFLRPPEKMGKLDRLAGAGMAWLARFEEKSEAKTPTAWKGDGANPLVIFKGPRDDPHQYYFGGKGGRAGISHGNMDAGSFVFELNGVRWVVDPGNQDYNTLEQTGFNLWGKGQDSERWTLLTKNNFGHSTLTVNNELFIHDGFAPLTNFKEGDHPEATFDLTAVYGDNVRRATRRFSKESPASLAIEDTIEISESTKEITWQLMTTAAVDLVDGGAVLRQAGKGLRVQILSHPESVVSVVSLDPPPLKLDRQIKGLKRLEIRIPMGKAVDGKIRFKVILAAE